MFSYIKYLLCIFLLLTNLYLFGLDEPWESNEIKTLSEAFQNDSKLMNDRDEGLLQWALNFYQEKQSNKTIHRCSFYISCSDYLPKALEIHGFPFGLFVFFDRYFYRENKAAFTYYPLKKRPDGVYKLDDEYFLY